MSDENKKNRVDFGGSQESYQDDYDLEESNSFTGKKESGGFISYIFMSLIIVALIISYYKISQDKTTLEKNIAKVKNDLKKIEDEKNKKKFGDLHIEIPDPEKDLPEDKKTSAPGVEIYVNGELRPDRSGKVDITHHDISKDLIFEFKKPGYYPLKLEVKSCNWQKKGDKYYYENKNLHLVIDENGMMAIEAAKKEKDKEAKNRAGKKKKRRRR